MVISLGSDHAGFILKERIKMELKNSGYEIIDFGADSGESVDYPDFIIPAAESVAKHEADCGIVFGGSGNGEAISANKVSGIRCAVCWNTLSAGLAKEHNNANMISLGARMIGQEDAVMIVRTWLDAKFEGGRHSVRLDKIAKYEQNK